MIAPHFQAYLHTIDPYAIRFGQSGFGIRWYGLSYLAGFVAGYYLITRLARKGKTPLPVAMVGDFVFWIALGTIIGGRLGFCLLYDPRLLTTILPSFPYWGVFAIHQGGMASHGGILGIIIACFIFGKRHGLSPFGLFDLTTSAGSLGIFFGRIANFINGELVGRPCAPDLPWAVKFPADILLWPTQEPDRLPTLAPVVQKLGINSQTWESIIAGKFPTSQVEHILNQIVGVVYSGNHAVAELLSPLLTARHPSQIYAALLEGALIFMVTTLLWRRKLREGVITGWFLVLYCIVRIFGEQFRMPDAAIGFQWLGLTRGQWLSIAMLLISVLYLLWRVVGQKSELKESCTPSRESQNI